MKRFAILFVILACATMSGCLVSSLHPFYNHKDKIFDKQLIGNWMDGDSSIWVITANKSSSSFMGPEVLDSTFSITYYEDEQKSLLQGTMFELDGKRYVDFYPDPDEDHCMSDMTSFHHVPVHTLARIKIKDNRVMLFWFGEEWLNELFEENRIRIAHETVEIGPSYSRHVLTASTEELQKFIRKYANAEDITKDIDQAFATGKESNDDHAFVMLSPFDGVLPEIN